MLAALAVLSPLNLLAQQAGIAGRVTDLETGSPVSAAAVLVLGLSDGRVATDESGAFRLSVPPGTHSVLVTRIGYETSRTDGVRVEAGDTVSVAIELRSRALALNQLVVTVSRREEKELDAPASISTLTGEQLSRIIARTPADHIKTLPGVDLAATGLTQSYVVVRGFNNVSSGRLLSIVDNRYARIPALRINAINMIPTTDMDIERIELARGPGAALYGPNAAEGVMHIITASPIDRPGTTVSLGGGRAVPVPASLMRSSHAGVGAVRAEGVGPVPPRQRLGIRGSVGGGGARRANPDHPRIGVRNPLNERYFADLRADYRFAEDGEFIVSGGLNNVAEQHQPYQHRVRRRRTTGSTATVRSRVLKDRLFGQVFLNQTHSGDNSYLLRSGDSPSWTGPAPWRPRCSTGWISANGRASPGGSTGSASNLAPRARSTGATRTTIVIVEAGAYLHSETQSGRTVSTWSTALRADNHNRLAEI